MSDAHAQMVEVNAPCGAFVFYATEHDYREHTPVTVQDATGLITPCEAADPARIGSLGVFEDGAVMRRDKSGRLLVVVLVPGISSREQ